jgi:choline dehydrogenase-like flavoprotein
LISDARSIPDGKTIDTDVCIVGAGVAGLTLAREFLGENTRVCLIESGGFEPDRTTQSLYWGEIRGFPYYPLDTSRARFFGGSSNCWHVPLGDNLLGARLRPLDPIDFEERDWVPYSGWPFTKDHLEPFYRRAQDVCRAGPFDYEAVNQENPGRNFRLPFLNGNIKTVIFNFIERDIFREYREAIRRSENISAFLHANAVDIETNASVQKVTRLHGTTLNGNSFSIRAKFLLLALGAIETSRLLLLSNTVQKTGLGNRYDLVGRFFMEHPHLWSGIYIPSDDKIFNSTGLYKIRKVNGFHEMGKLALSEDVLRQERILNYCTSIHPKMYPEPETGRGTAKALFRKMGVKRKIKAFHLNHMSEQLPNPASRVVLSDECDALGKRRADLDWRLSPLDMRTIIRAQEIIDEELRRAGLGRLHIEMQSETPPPHLTGGWHHMGTTRMNSDPKKGVVDKHSRVHGIDNLFIAGPSVFPTSGYANPVLTIIALTLRLADHVKSRVAEYDKIGKVGAKVGE